MENKPYQHKAYHLTHSLTIRQIFIHLIVRLLFLADIVNGGVLGQEIIYFYNKSQQSAWRRGHRH